MVDIIFNPATKKVSFNEEDLSSLDPCARGEASQAADLVNTLMSELVAVNGEVPPAPNVITKNVSVSAAKLVGNASKCLQNGKAEDAIKLLSTALEMVLRRPLWEATMLTLDEVCRCLSPRCDAYLTLKRWPEAYADISMLMLLKPDDPHNYFRKGVILFNSGKREEGKEFLRSAQTAAPHITLFKAVLEQSEKPESREIQITSK